MTTPENPSEANGNIGGVRAVCAQISAALGEEVIPDLTSATGTMDTLSSLLEMAQGDIRLTVIRGLGGLLPSLEDHIESLGVTSETTAGLGNTANRTFAGSSNKNLREVGDKLIATGAATADEVPRASNITARVEAVVNTAKAMVEELGAIAVAAGESKLVHGSSYDTAAESKAIVDTAQLM